MIAIEIFSVLVIYEIEFRVSAAKWASLMLYVLHGFGTFVYLTLELSRAAKRRRLERIVRHHLPTTLVLSPFT